MKFLSRAGMALIVGIALISLHGCAQQPPAASPVPPPPAAAPAVVEQPSPPVEAPDIEDVEPLEPEPSESNLVLPKQNLSKEVLYAFLVAELAAQRENYTLAARTYVELARRTRDPRVARRAVDMAFVARNPELAIEATRLWLKTEPDSDDAVRRLAGLLVSTNRVDEARPYLERLLTAEGSSQSDGFMQLNRLIAGNPDRAENLRTVQELAKKRPDLAEAHFAVAYAALQAGENDLAVTEVEAANKLKPNWDMGVLLQAQVLQRAKGNDAAAAYLENYLQAHPKSRELRLSYARVLTADKKYVEARAQFEHVLKENTADPDVLLSVAALAATLKDWDAAEAHFKRYLDLDSRNADLARFNLGQIAEERQRYTEAVEWYRGVTPSSDSYLSAQLRQAHIQAKQGDPEGARKFLHQITPKSNQQRVQIVLSEAGVLNDAQRPKEALEVISQALEKLPNDSDLLYQQSMQAEKIGRFEVAESSLRKLIRLKPDHAHAYNALGYSLAERNERLPEAHELIKKAVALSPDDFFIMDSMGWVLYRQGKNEEAIKWLRRAYAGRNDAEIAAHLGEVLWVSGQRDEAKKLWAEALSRTPDNDVLQKTVQRLQK